MKALKRTWGSRFKYHEWVAYLEEGASKTAYAEPEGYIEFPDFVLLLEMKLTGGPYGKAQMEGFYKPLLEFILKKPVRCLLICKNVGHGTPEPFVDGVDQFVQRRLSFATWHNLG